MLTNILNKVSARLPFRRITGENGEPYLERYFVCRVFGCEVLLHRFVDSDPDRGLHNHPWKWAASLVLSGEYIELVWCPSAVWTHKRDRRRFDFTVFGANHFHRVVLPRRTLDKPEPCWTLFVTGPRTPGSMWGFLKHMCRTGDKQSWSFQRYTGSPHPEWWRTAGNRKENEAYQQQHSRRHSDG